MKKKNHKLEKDYLKGSAKFNLMNKYCLRKKGYTQISNKAVRRKKNNNYLATVHM